MMNTTYKLGESDQRQWGSWEVIAINHGYVVKEIIVQPGQELSLQRHNHREEHWTIIEGVAEVTINDSVSEVAAGSPSVFIPKLSKHRVANRSDSPLKFIEIQTGSILDESDIERFSDKYGRC